MERSFYRVGIIGFGMIGKVHAYAHAAMPYYSPGLARYGKVTRLVTGHRETAEQGATTVGADFYSTDWHDITDSPEIDIVHICTPNDQHCEQVLAAIRHNKHLYCDKPLCVSASESDAIRSALLRTGPNGRPLYTGTTQMTFHLRFYPAIIRARELMAAGRLGRLFQYRIGYYHSSNARPDTPFKWKQGAGGGVIRDLGAHLLDLVDYLVGMPDRLIADSAIAWPTRFGQGKESGRKIEIEGEDTVSVMTRHTTEVETPFTGLIEATKLATGEEDDVRFEIHGTKGALRFSLMNSHYLDFFDATAATEPHGGESGWTQIACGARYTAPDGPFPSPKATTGWVRGHVASLSNFLQAVNEGRQTSPNLLQGCRVQTALEAIAESCRLRNWVELNF